MGMRVGGGRQPLTELDILCLSEAQGHPLPFFGVVFMLTQPPQQLFLLAGPRVSTQFIGKPCVIML